MNDSSPKDSKSAFVPLIALVKKNRKLFIDDTAVDNGGLQLLVDKNKKLVLRSHDAFYMAAFVYRKLAGKSKALADFLVNNKVLTVLDADGAADYPAFIPKVAPMSKEKGQLCFVIGKDAGSRQFVTAAKAAGVFIQIFVMADDGTLQHSLPETHAKPKDKAPAQPQERQMSDDALRRLIANQPFVIRSVPARMTISRLRPARQPATGDRLLDSASKTVAIGEPVMQHPNATTFATDRPGICAKIFNASELNTFLEEKVKRMLTRHIRSEGLCWPLDILRDETGCFVGYLLPAAKGEPLHLSVFKQSKLQQLFPDWNKADLCDLAITILNQIKYLHSKNILMGCINPAAIRVAGKNEVYFVDTDNYQIEGFPSLVYNTTFTPPELLGRRIYLCNKENENYAVALLLFMLMMPGKLPYTLGKGATPEDRILNSRFAFSFKDEHGSFAMPSVWRFMWSHLTPFKQLFYGTFRKGERYSLPEQRRSADEWLGTVYYFKKSILDGASDKESLKIYPQSFKHRQGVRYFRCKVCGVSHPEFYFHDTNYDDALVCNGCIDKMSDVSFTCQCCHKTYYYTNRTALFHRMKKDQDASWRDQKYCRDCKNKTVVCQRCHQEKPYYLVKNGLCPDCNTERRNAVYMTRTCKDCGRSFTISVGEHEALAIKGFTDPVRCEQCRRNKKG